MDRFPVSHEDEEASAEHSAILVADIVEQLPKLKLKLDEYLQRNAGRGLGYKHPDQIASEYREIEVLKPAVLESIIELASSKNPSERVYMHEVAVLTQGKTGIDVSRAALVPFKYNDLEMSYEPDIPEVQAFAGQTGFAFVSAYRISMGYCSGNMWGIEGGTGLPEA